MDENKKGRISDKIIFGLFLFIVLSVFAYSASYANERAVVIDDVKLSKTATVVVGFDDTADFNVNDYADADDALDAVWDYLNSTGLRGTVFLKAGLYNFKASTNLSRMSNPPRCCIRIMGEGDSTIILKNHTAKSGTTYSGTIFNLGSSNFSKMTDIEIDHMQLAVANETVGGGLVAGSPQGSTTNTSLYHERITVHDITGIDIYGRFSDLNANHRHMYLIWINGSRGLAGGSGHFWEIHDNYIHSDGKEVSEYEGVDVNGAYMYASLYNNIILNFYEQGIDCGNNFCRATNNHIEMHVPTYQPCITFQSNSIIKGNYCTFGRNATGTIFAGYESYGGARNNIIEGNTAVANLTGAQHNRTVVCLMIGSNDSVISNNRWENCVPYSNHSGSGAGITAGNNIFTNNIMKNVSGLLQYGMNATVNGDFDTTSGNFTIRSPWFAGSGSAIACFDQEGRLYRGNSTGCP